MARDSVQNRPQPAATPQRAAKDIGLWGSPGSGKSSFIAALNVAVAQSRSGWTLVGSDDDSVDFLTRSTEILTSERKFPPATEFLEEMGWVLLHETEVRTRSGLFRREEVTRRLRELQIELLDAPGRLFSGSEAEKPASGSAGEDLDLFDEGPPSDHVVVDSSSLADERQLVERLSYCNGIVYLFDPIREIKHGDAFHYFQRVLAQIAQLSRESGRMTGARLPHHLAVCVTKFDDPRVYELARRKRYLAFDAERMFPRVDPDSAGELFHTLCRVASTGNASLVRDTIDRFFQPERVRYFATSSVGFYLHRSQRFRPNDYQNVVGEGYNARIRGQINPINVLEPLLWLGEQLSDGEGR